MDSYKLASQIVAILINIIISLQNIDIFEDGVEMGAKDSWSLFILKIVHFNIILVYVFKIVASEKAYLFDEYCAKEKKPMPSNIIMRMYLLIKLVYHSSKFTEISFLIGFTTIAFFNPTLYSIHVFAMFSRI